MTAREAVLAEGCLARDAGGWLRMEEVDLRALAGAVGTPAFVYSRRALRTRYAELSAAFRDVAHRIHFAVKANGNLAVLRTFRELGAGADIVSIGELRRCLAAGFDPADVVFSGVGKTGTELDEAVAAGLASINVESLEELERLGRRAGGRSVAIGIRLNPDVVAQTHPYISTGQAGIKFGIPVEELGEAIAVLGRHPGLRLVTLAVHVGSQLLDPEPFRRAALRLVEALAEVRAAGVTTVRALDIGGGLGIRYGDERGLGPAAYAETIVPVLAPTGLAIHLEPGRFLVGNAGVLLTSVLVRKRGGGKAFIVVDAGMTELARPSRYNAFHDIVPVGPPEGTAMHCDVVGPVCETGDFLGLDRLLPDRLGAGDLLAVLGAGAYGFVMGSTYNARPRPPEILVEGSGWGVARRRETVDELYGGESAEPLMEGRPG